MAEGGLKGLSEVADMMTKRQATSPPPGRHDNRRQRVAGPAAAAAAGFGKAFAAGTNAALINTKFHGTIDGAFDAGLLATVQMKGRTYRAMLFSPHLPQEVSPRTSDDGGGATDIDGGADPMGLKRTSDSDGMLDVLGFPALSATVSPEDLSGQMVPHLNDSGGL